jgi:ankyrin repeat protein
MSGVVSWILSHLGLSSSSKNALNARLVIELANWQRLSTIKELLDSGASVHARNPNDRGSLLQSAAVSGRIDIAELLIERGA